MKHIETYTCIRFIDEIFDDFVLIYSGKGCFSNLGRTGGQQEVSLQKNGCLSQGTIVHELIHALGFGKLLLRFLEAQIYLLNLHRSHAKSRKT
jgi:hypothetical protein